MTDIQIQPLTPERWPDLERLFGERGACGGCWCMWWRLKRSQFDRQKGQENRRALKAIVDSGETPGLLGYVCGEPIAWCAIAPREVYPVLERSRILKRVDDEPVWSVVCLFIARPFRRQGITVLLLKAAVEYAAQYGARVVEGYPVEPSTTAMPAAFAWTGIASAFRNAGFTEVLRRSATRPIMHYVVRVAPA
ncbi:MAG TPA: GNAT family N-acetyltransferase, partial [Roseiflexaceae bacterium]